MNENPYAWIRWTMLGLLVLGVLMGLAVRLPPVLRFARSSPRKRAAAVVITGLLIWLIELEGLLGLMMSFSYWLGDWKQYAYPPVLKNFNNPTAVVVELWLRQFSLWGRLGHTCFTANVVACKVADTVFVSPMYQDLPDTIMRLVAILALVVALIAMGVGWWQTRAKSPKK